MAVAFPTSIGDLLERKTPFKMHPGVEMDVMDDGTPYTRVLSTDVYDNVRCRWRGLTQTEFDTLRSFYETNAAEVVTWTVDGVSYEGHFHGELGKTMVGNRYNATLDYYAKVV